MLFVTHERTLFFRSLSPKKGSKQGIMHYDGEPEQQNIVYSSCRYFKITRIALRRVERLPKSQRCAGCYVGQLESYAKRIRMLWQCGKKYTLRKSYTYIYRIPTKIIYMYACRRRRVGIDDRQHSIKRIPVTKNSKTSLPKL